MSATDPGSPFGTFATIFAMTALPFGIIFGLMQGDMQGGLVAGFFFGLLFGLCMTPLMRVDRQVRPYSKRERFERLLKVELAELRYTSMGTDPDHLQFRAPNSLAVSLNKVSVHLDDEDGKATLIGPRHAVKKILRRLDAVG